MYILSAVYRPCKEEVTVCFHKSQEHEWGGKMVAGEVFNSKNVKTFNTACFGESSFSQ